MRQQFMQLPKSSIVAQALVAGSQAGRFYRWRRGRGRGFGGRNRSNGGHGISSGETSEGVKQSNGADGTSETSPLSGDMRGKCRRCKLPGHY